MLYPPTYSLEPSTFSLPPPTLNLELSTLNQFPFATEECLDASLHVLQMGTFPVNPLAAGTLKKIVLLVEGIFGNPSPCLLVGDPFQRVVTQEASRKESVRIEGQKALVDQLAKLFSGMIPHDPNDLVLRPSRSKSGVACQDRPILFSSDRDETIKVIAPIVNRIITQFPELFHQFPKVSIGDEPHRPFRTKNSEP